jgi:N-acyl-D-aspartate/D-glutamate deacylase
VIEMQGRWLMPGLLDIHTHLDLEVELAPALPEVLRHGSTTVIMSNCSLGVTYGHQRRDGTDPIVDCFARVENIPKHVLRKVGDACTWRTSAEYLEHFKHLPLGPNVVPLIPHSMLRIEVMGLRDSVERNATPDEINLMADLLERAMQEGYAGFSSDGLPFHFLAHHDLLRNPIPTQFGSYAELKRLAGVLRQHNRVWQATPHKDNTLAIVRNFMLTSGRLHGKPLKVTAVAAIDVHTNGSIVKLGMVLSRVLNSWLVNGRFRLQALAAPFKVWSDGAINPLSEEIPELRVLNELDLDDHAGRLRVMANPAWETAYRRMWAEGKRGFGLAALRRVLKREHNVLNRRLDDMFVETCPLPHWSGQALQAPFARLQQWQRTGQGAQGSDEAALFATFPPNTDDAGFFLHLLRQWDTALRWHTTVANRNAAILKRLLFHPQTLPGFNDSGAHLNNMAFYDGNLRTLKIAQADGDAAVALAVHRHTQMPAEFFGLNVGVVAVGAQADLCIVDPQALQRWDPNQTYGVIERAEFDCKQMVNRPPGVVTQVLVAGQLAWSEGAYTAVVGKERLGRVLRAKEHPMEAVLRAPQKSTA